jgi:hypothetical protein
MVAEMSQVPTFTTSTSPADGLNDGVVNVFVLPPLVPDRTKYAWTSVGTGYLPSPAQR